MEQRIVSKVIIEMMGNPKEHLANELRQYIEKLKTDNNKKLSIISEDYAEPTKVEKEELYTMFVELEIDAKDLETLIWLCFDYRPSSIEIVEPEELVCKARNFNELLNDVLGKLHHLDMGIGKLDAQNKLMNKNAQILTTNFIYYILQQKKPSTLLEIKKITGIDEKTLKTVLDRLVEEKSIKRNNDLYLINA